MPLTLEIFTRRALREARKGLSEEESKIYFDQALLLFPKAMDQLALEVTLDPRQRGSLRARLAITLTNGYADLAERPEIFVKGLPFSEAFDADTGEEKTRLLWKDDPAALNQWLSPVFGYYSVRENRIVTRKAGSQALGEMQDLILYTICVPDFDTYPIPEELQPRALSIFAQLLQPLMPPAADVAQK